MCFKINIKLVTSHIGETYLEDEHGQARLGATILLLISESAFVIYIYIYIYFPEIVLMELIF